MIPAARRRLVVLSVLFFVLLASLGGKLWNLQVMTGVSYASAAAHDQTQTIIVPPVRGQILDDTGQPLVDNQTALVVSVNRALLMQQPGGGIPELRRLATLLRISYPLLQEKLRLCTKGVSQPCWQGSPYQPIPVDQQANDRIALQIMESQRSYPGVTAQPQPVTNYVEPDAADAAQVLGYLQPITSQEVAQRHLPLTGFSGVDLVGQAGLEEQYDRQLRGTPGRQLLSVNAAGQVLGINHTMPARAGDDLVTSINSQLEQDVYTVLAKAVHKAYGAGNTGATKGAAVVMTTTGRVVAMASYPSYDPSIWNGGITSREFRDLFGAGHGEPILNQVTQGEYPPGSTWKVTTTAAAVQQGYSLYGTYNCPGTVSIDGQSFANDGQPSLGPMTFNEALIQSCDTVYYTLGYDMWLRDHPSINSTPNPHAPLQPMIRMEEKWGFGTSPGVDLPEQDAGTLPSRQWLYWLWKDNKHYWCRAGRQSGSYIQRIEWQDCQDGFVWEPGQAAIAAIGQGYVTVTPLQLADAYAALANGGTLYSPRVGEALLSPDGKTIQKINPPVVRHLPVSGTTLAYIRNALRGVVTQGTAAGAFAGFPLNKVCVAGKTGTADVAGAQSNSVFASFAPCNHPQYVVVVMIPHAGYGAQASAPAVRLIWDDLYGLEKHPAAVPGGQVPGTLPAISSVGAITPPPGFSGERRMSVFGRDTGLRGLPPVLPGEYGSRGIFRPSALRDLVTSKESKLRHTDWLLVLAVLALSLMGTLLVWSATAPALSQAGENPHAYLDRQFLNVGIGLVLMVGVSMLDYRLIKACAPYAYLAALVLLLAVLTPAGTVVNGAHAWIALPGGFQIEPSEFIKLGLVMLLAVILGRARTQTQPPSLRQLGLALVCAAPAIGLVLKEPALGVAIVLVAVLAGMIVLSGLRLRWVALLTALAGLGVYGAAHAHVLKAYQMQRLTSFLHPDKNLQSTGYNALQAKIMVGSGGMFGQGLFHGTLVAGNFVPNQQTDFIFTVAGEELGFAGVIAIIAVLGVVLLRALRIAARADDMFGLLAASGIAVWFGVQTFVNIGMTIGIAPITGIPLPFLSYGGSAMFADMIAIGVLQSVHRRHKLFT